MIQITIRIAVLLVLCLSTNALFMLGSTYQSSGGSPLEKMHPSLYVVVLGLSLVLLASRGGGFRTRLQGMAGPTSLMIFGAAAITVWAILSPNAGGEISAPIVTFLLPALLLLLLQWSSISTLKFVSSFLHIFFVLNSLAGLFAYLTGFNLLENTAGAMVVRDPRPTGLLGHPLINAQMTGAWVLYLVLGGIKRGFKGQTLVQASLHSLALVAFGGRSALAFVVVILFAYSMYRAYHGVVTGKSKSIFNLMVLGLIALAVVAFSIQAGITEVLFDRLNDDRGSADTRIAALQMLGILDLGQWFVGVGPSQRNAMLLYLNTPVGIESFPIAILVNYGLPAMLLITGTSFYALFKLAAPLKGVGAWLVIYFFVSSAASLSLGSKTTSMSIFVLVLVAFRQLAIDDRVDAVVGAADAPSTRAVTPA